MGTQAQASFEDNWTTISHLMSIGEEGTRTQPQRAAVNRAALIFIVTVWESYVEDVVREAADLMATHCPSFQDLPKSVQKSIVKHITPKQGFGTKSPSGKYAFHVAGDGWRALLRGFAYDATDGQNFNTPNTKNVRELFTAWMGKDVTESWSWQHFATPKAADRLDETIVLRGDIVHTGQKPDGLSRNWINTYGDANIRKLVVRTDRAVIEHVNSICQKDVWAASTP